MFISLLPWNQSLTISRWTADEFDSADNDYNNAAIFCSYNAVVIFSFVTSLAVAQTMSTSMTTEDML